MKVKVHQTSPPTRASAVCQLELRPETSSKKGWVELIALQEPLAVFISL